MSVAAEGGTTGSALAVRTAEPARWSELSASELTLVRDAGFTEIAPGLTVAVEGHDRVGALPKSVPDAAV